MTNAVAADSNSARADSGRRTSLRRVQAALLALLMALPVLALATPAHAVITTEPANFSWGTTGYPMGFTFHTGHAYEGATSLHYCSNTGTTKQAVNWMNGAVNVGVAYSHNLAPSCSGGGVVTLVEIRAVTSGFSDENSPVIATYDPINSEPFACDDGDLTPELEEWGGYGGGGSWGASNPDGESLWEMIQEAANEARNPVLLWRNLLEENPQVLDAYQSYEGWFWAQYDELTGQWSLFDANDDPVNKDTVGFGGYGGGGEWGIGCDADEDGTPDVPTTGGTSPVIVPVSQPPAPDATAAPSGSCDFGLLDPSSWLCSLGGLFGQLLDVIRQILAWLGRLGGFLLDLFVPDPDVLQDKFADVDTAWDASGPGQLTGGLTDIAAPVLAMDENMPTTCAGPQFTLPLPDSRSFSMNPLSTCGELTQYILGVVYPLETALIYLGGFFLGLRIVTRPFGMETPGTGQAATA